MSIQWTLVFLCTCAAAFAAEEQAKPEIPTIPAPVTKLALFKNGIGAVVRKANPTPTPFLVKDSMTPIHGTLWFMPSDGLSVRTVKQRVREPNTQPFQNLTASYEGRAVQLTLSGNSETPSEIIGKVIRPVKETPQKQRDAGYNSFQPSTERFLTLSLNSGEIISIDTSRIISIRALKINQTLEMEKEALLITPKVKSAGPLAICYLTKGAAWAPSYRLELGKDSAMRLSMSTVIMNELEDLKDVETLDEVVVVGYGVQNKRDVTGSIAKVGSEELMSVPTSSFDAALQGRAAGVQVTQTSGLALVQPFE